MQLVENDVLRDSDAWCMYIVYTRENKAASSRCFSLPVQTFTLPLIFTRPITQRVHIALRAPACTYARANLLFTRGAGVFLAGQTDTRVGFH